MTNDAPISPNPYQILGIEPSFAITQDQIQRAYLHKLSTAHPDLVAQDTDSDQPPLDPLDPAALNHARDTLLSHQARATLLLSLLDNPTTDNKTLPDGFLMEMMQLRTQIEEELETNPAEARPRWESWADDRHTETITQITTLFTQLEAKGSNQTDLVKQIQTHLNADRYTQRLIEQLDPDYNPAQADF